MFVSLFCLFKKGLVDSGLFFHVLFPLSVAEMALEMALINWIEGLSSKGLGNGD